MTGGRYKMCVEVPVQKTMFRLLPAPLQAGAEISVSAILFTQGINEQQTIADRLVRWLRDFPSISVPGDQVWRQHSAGPDQCPESDGADSLLLQIQGMSGQLQ